MKEPLRKILKALSYGEIEVETSRKFADLKKLDPMKIFYHKLDYDLDAGDHKIPTRIYLPSDKVNDGGHVLLFFHGGGWVTDSVENYDRICAKMAEDLQGIVISVDYRLAPENPFPAGLQDCYAVAKALFSKRFILNVDPERITIIGDSAGGNLTAAVCQMARDTREFTPKRQILIYPATNNDYSESSPFASVHENGENYLLTAGKLRDYLKLYESCPEDRQNPYFAPILAKDFTGLPKTLILTAEYDPLRDEGEAYGEKLRQAGNDVKVHRIPEGLHGFFALGIKNLFVQESFDYIQDFLEGEKKCLIPDAPIGEN